MATAVESAHGEATPGSAGVEGTPATHWYALRIFNLYRLALSGLCVVLAHSDAHVTPLGQADPRLFYVVSLAYVAFAILCIFTINTRRPQFTTQVYSQVAFDIPAVTLLMHASGGIESGLGMLLIVNVAGAGMLAVGRMAGLFAALATLALLLEQVYSQVTGAVEEGSYPRAGMLGVALFATTILTHVLSRRLRESEALAEQRGIDLANLEQLAGYVIQQMQTGVVVLDRHGQVPLVNAAALRLLGIPAAEGGAPLGAVPPTVVARIHSWLEGRQEGGTGSLVPTFVRVGMESNGGVLVFLEDDSVVAKQAQQLKLAALGRLTASIAHEIRNPLSAISHAGQLLAESPHLDASDRRLTEIIRQQSLRVNTIIESVLQLGRRDQSRPQTFPLEPWLRRFVENYACTANIDPACLTVSVKQPELQVRFDQTHLDQILGNLCRNGLHHSGKIGREGVEVVLDRDEGGRVFLEVADDGPGVRSDLVHQIFEPFLTTEPGGTGLGLYISRELAQCNGARLELAPPVGGEGARFRLTFGNDTTH